MSGTNYRIKRYLNGGKIVLEQNENLVPSAIFNPKGTFWSNFYLYVKDDS